MTHHEPFKSLSPLSWSADIESRDPAALADLFRSTLANAQLLIDSIPTPTLTSPPPQQGEKSATGTGTRRARSHTDSAALPPASPALLLGDHHAGRGNGKGEKRRDGGGDGDEGEERERGEEERETVRRLVGEWKDLKMGGANPCGISVLKMPAKDGKGAWFARRSVHRCGGGLSYDKWEAALRKEMDETLVHGNVRGLRAEKSLERVEVEGGEMRVYQASVKFPGPTTDRDFVTVIMIPNTKQNSKGAKGRQPRQFMMVSRPCDHPDCPPRSGFIRGTYESVELIREVPVEKPLRKTKSSIDLGAEDLRDIMRGGGQEHVSKESLLRAAKKAAGDEAESEGERGKAVSFTGSPVRSSAAGEEDDMEMAVEWLMVTRSDPGGSVPRFMVEKGTPGSVTNDAAKFIKWLSSQSLKDFSAAPKAPGNSQETASAAAEGPAQAPTNMSAQDHLPNGNTEHPPDEQPQTSTTGGGLYGFLANALGAAGSALASRVAAFAPPFLTATESYSSDYEEEGEISDGSFASAEDGSVAVNTDTTAAEPDPVVADAASTFSSTASNARSRETTPLSRAQSQHEKELGKLQQRMRKAQEKLERAQAKRLGKHASGNNKGNDNSTASDGTTPTPPPPPPPGEEDAAIAKLREKHARELAKQQEKYQRELRRLADKRAAEERKAAERRKKAAEREERADLRMELDRARAERDLARKEADMLRERVGELQAQNTMLVARLGREGGVGADVERGK